jgi:hypothetical protein
VDQLKPDIIGISETWAVSDKHTDAELSLLGYKLFRVDRDDPHKLRGGGCLLYVSNKLTSYESPGLDNKGTESVWVDITVNNKDTLTVGMCYRPKDINQEHNTRLEKLIKSASEKWAIILGDFNHPTINWNDFSYTEKADGYFIDFVNDCFLTQHILNSTHRAGNTLDLIMTTEPDMIENIQMIGRLGASDHDIIQCDLRAEVNIDESYKVTFNYNKGDYQGMSDHLSKIDWEHELICPDNRDNLTEYMYHKFTMIINTAVDMFIPKKRIKKNKKAKWMTKAAKAAVKKKYKLYKRYRETKTYQEECEYKKARNEATKAIKKARRNFEEKLAKNIKTDSKSYYAYTRASLKSRSTLGPLKDDQGNIIRTNKDSANTLNNFFTSVFTKEDASNIPDPDKSFDAATNKALVDIIITEEITEKFLNLLKPDKSPGGDNMFPLLLRETRSVIKKPLTMIFENSIRRQEVPEEWKVANK